MHRRHARRSHSGFTLMDLMIAVAVLGTLMTLAIPVYNDYLVRARVVQVLTSIDTLRTVFHAEYEVEGRIPRFKAGKEGELPSELSRLSFGPDLLNFGHLEEYLFQSSHHYGPFEGKDIPYLVLVAKNAEQTRYLQAIARVLPHSAYAWTIESVAMVVPLLNAETRHDSIIKALQAPKKNQPTQQPMAQPTPQPIAQPQPQPVLQPQILKPQPQQPGQQTTVMGGGPTQATSQQGVAPGGSSSTANSHQQYEDCRAHVLANHPHGHAFGLFKQCNRYAH